MQRRVEPHDSLDDFPTPPWATRALCERINCSGLSVREPAANRGHMVKPLSEYFVSVEAADVHDYGAGYPVRDYLFGDHDDVDWTITNPPFRLAVQFVKKALSSSTEGVALIVRSAFLEGIQRYAGLYSVTPPARILQFSERVVMHKGKLTATGSTATAYCWLIWEKSWSYSNPTTFEWIPPCRKRLQRAEDYL